MANVHVTMMAHDNPSYRKAVEEADLVVPDGMPLVWAMRLMGSKGQERVYGPGLTLEICRWAQQNRVPVYFYGSTPAVLESLRAKLIERFPQLEIRGLYSPPFRSLTAEEDEEDVKRINSSGARIIFVGLGAPKQERWMAAHRDKVQGVMVGVGAAFDILSGRVPQAPEWIQKAGLEWLHRLLLEPRRLWRRYFYYNPRFLLLITLQLLGLRRFEGKKV